MKLLFKLIFILFFSTNCIISQTLDAQVFGSSGDFFSNEKTLSSTLGEVVVYGYYQESFDLHQGFQNIAADLVCSFECVLYNHLIDLPEGWSYWSTYLSPKDSEMEDIFSQINEDVVILKDQNGEVYWPYFGINGINSHNDGEGYQIKMNTNQVLDIEGYIQINPTIAISEDWNILGCLYHEPVLIEESLLPIVENVILVKDENANVFWPYLSIITIEYFMPGEGYAIKLDSDLNFTFYNQLEEESSRFLIVSNEKDSSYFSPPIKTNHNMTVGFSYEILKDHMVYGDEIAAFDVNNNVVGLQIYENSNLALTIWGDDPFTTIKDGMLDLESLSFRIWNKNQNHESEIEILEWQQGSNYYTTDGINIVGDVALNKQEFSSLISVSPNPLKSNAEIKFDISDNCLVSIYLVNNLGIKENLLKAELNKGLHNFNFEINQSPGVYHVVIENCTNTMSIPFIVVK